MLEKAVISFADRGEGNASPIRGRPASSQRQDQNSDRERVGGHLVRLAIFEQPARSAPNSRFEIDVTPIHRRDLTATCRGRNREPHEVTGDRGHAGRGSSWAA